MKNECSMFKAHCSDRNLEGYISSLFLYICISFFSSVLTCFTIPCLAQMPQIAPEDEEGACHPEAEAGDIFSGKRNTLICKDQRPCCCPLSFAVFLHGWWTSVRTYLPLADETVAEASRSSRACSELMEVTRIAWNAVPKEIMVWTTSVPLDE